MNRLYAIECAPHPDSAAADHRLPVPARDVALFARAIAAELGMPEERTPESLGAHRPWIDALARDLKAHRGASLVIAGDCQPAEVHALAQLMNHALGNVGKTVDFIPRIDSGPADQMESIRDLVRAMGSGEVETLLILGGNPAYDAPADLEFARRLADKNVKLRIHFGLYDDETAQLCHWHIPEAHCLETWSDLRAFDGTAAIVQPLIAPLYKGRSPHEILTLLLGQPDLSPLEIVRDYWRRRKLARFRVGLAAGARDGRDRRHALRAQRGHAHRQRPEESGALSPAADALEIVFRPDPTIGDGRFANNGWLQELPKPLTKLSWDNAALVSPATAQKLGLETEDLVDLRQGGRTVRLPVMVLPGQADSSITVTLGLGRRRAGRVGTGVGVDVYPLRTSDAPWFASGLEVVKTSEQRRLAAMHHHFSMEGRDLIRVESIDDYRRDPAFAHRPEEEETHGRSLIDDPAPQAEHERGEGNAWGMAINLNTCIGCGACVAACQAENNIPIVGREQVLVSREMHWIRVDRYFEGTDTANPKVDFQPVPCMQCEKAPCEVVCPVGATTHSAEGLNEMTYNRCVGTRYCSNNCPYKVRRFNFLHYNDDTTASLKLMRNPDVTVRSRGVMEKCTYCVQRINAARIGAEMEHRELGGDEVVTACQAACPTRAIVFGNLNARESAVSKAKANPRNYALLAELNTRPRTTYLAKLRNPNPEIEAISAMAHTDPESAYTPATSPVLGPGHTYATVTDKISALVLHAPVQLALVPGHGYRVHPDNGPLRVDHGAAPGGRRRLGHRRAGDVGLCDHQLRLVDRHRTRGHVDLGDSAPLEAGLADVDQPLCRGDDALCRGLRGPLSACFTWAGPGSSTGCCRIPTPWASGPSGAVRSIWDVFAVSTYATVSLLFWYVGLIPDLATLRDRAQNRWAQYIYGILAMGWRGSARHWHRYRTAYILLAGLATPLVVSVHTIVALDFTVAILPGWHSTIFPPYFVAGAIFSGFAMVVTLALPLRAAFGLHDFITDRHLDNMAKVMLATGMIVAYGYLMEAFMAWYGQNPYETLRAAQEPTVRPVRPHLPDDADLQRLDPAASLVSPDAGERATPVADLDRGEYRHVARALCDRGHQLASRFLAVVVEHVPRDVLGLLDVLRDARPVSVPHVLVHPLLAGDLDHRDARAGARDARGSRAAGSRAASTWGDLMSLHARSESSLRTHGRVC